MFKYILTVLILFFSTYAISNESNLTISQQLERLQREVTDLSKEVFSNPSNQSSGTNNDFVKMLSKNSFVFSKISFSSYFNTLFLFLTILFITSFFNF